MQLSIKVLGQSLGSEHAEETYWCEALLGISRDEIGRIFGFLDFRVSS